MSAAERVPRVFIGHFGRRPKCSRRLGPHRKWRSRSVRFFSTICRLRLARWDTLLDKPDQRFERFRERLFADVKLAIDAVRWPPESAGFTIRPESGKKRGEGNGVKPIKDAFI